MQHAKLVAGSQNPCMLLPVPNLTLCVLLQLPDLAALASAEANGYMGLQHALQLRTCRQNLLRLMLSG